MNRKFTFIMLVASVIILHSCRVDSTLRTPYIAYYKGDNTLLYFIKPLHLYNDKNKMSIDFTFIDKKENDTASVTANYTFYNYNKSKSDIFYIQIDSNKYKLLNTEIIFEEIKKGQHIVRYSSKITQKELVKLLDKSSFQFVVENKQLNRTYSTNKKYAKKLKKTSNDISSIIKDKFE